MKKYTQEELQEIIKRHEMWLNNRYKMWLNDTECGERANLQGANLEGANLRDADLRLADFQNSNLYLVKLEDADLRDADLHGANLRGAYLCGANLRNVKLQGASLQGANLGNVKLPHGFYQVVGCGCIGRCTTYDSINDQVVCGCWDDGNGNHLEAFKQRVENIYGEDDDTPNKKYYAQYMAAIRFFEAMKKAEE